MITSHSLVIDIPPSVPSLSLVYDIPPGQFPALSPDYQQGKLQTRTELQIRFQITKNIRASRGENGSMPTDFIYLRSVKARIRVRDKVRHVIYFNGAVFMHRQEREEMRKQEGGA